MHVWCGLQVQRGPGSWATAAVRGFSDGTSAPWRGTTSSWNELQCSLRPSPLEVALQTVLLDIAGLHTLFPIPQRAKFNVHCLELP